MTHYQLTLDAELLHQLFVGNSQDPGVARLLESVLNQVLQAQAQEQLGAAPYERTEQRDDQRNGSYTFPLVQPDLDLHHTGVTVSLM